MSQTHGRTDARTHRVPDGPSEDVVLIESLAAGGDGVGHLADGMTVFVPRTAPGDRVRLADAVRRRRHARARLAELLVAGPDRVAPPCGHFGRDGCGSCQWQHLSSDAQAAAKRRIVGDALRRLAGLAVPDPELVPSPRSLAYRGTITLTVVARADAPVVGFHRADQADAVFPLERCEIARDELNALWAAVRPFATALPRGPDVRLALRVSEDGALHAVVRGGNRAWGGAEPLARAAAAAGRPATIWWQPAGGTARRMAGPPAQPDAIAFEQVNAEVAAALRRDILTAVPAPPASVLDLYAGACVVSEALARRGHEVVAVELDQRAVRGARERTRASGLDLRIVAARVEDVLEGLLPSAAVIVNPPRAGLAEQVSTILAGAEPSRLIYVSCDPATLARDLRRLGATPERLSVVRCFDMFPQTSQVETLVVLDSSAVTEPDVADVA